MAQVDGTGEATVAELSDGRIYYNSRGHWEENPKPTRRRCAWSTDGGETWEKVLYIDEKTGAIDLALDPEDPETLYAAVWQRIRLKWNDPRNLPGFDQSGVYKSTDGGATWKPINNGLPEGKFRGRIGFGGWPTTASS